MSLGRIQGTSSYTALFGSNTGTDQTGWYYYFGLTPSQISTDLSNNRAQLVDLDHNDDTNTFNALMYSTTSPWTWYYDSSLSALTTRASQTGQRLFDLTPYVVSGHTYYAGVLTNALDATSLAEKNIYAPTIATGTWGFELKQVNGPVLAALQPNTAFDPASSIKVVYHYKNVASLQAGDTTQSTSVTYVYDPSRPDTPGICPDDFSATKTTGLKNADTQMMMVSDNRMTLGIQNLYGKQAMLDEASHLGMTSTHLNTTIGCGTKTSRNYTTLSDLEKVYEAYATSADLTSPRWRAVFHDQMVNETGYPSYRANVICPVVQQEASSLGKSSSVADSFCQAVTWIAKGGYYQYGGSTPYVTDRTDGSLTRLPFKSSSGAAAPKSYFWGDYVDLQTISSTDQANAVEAARTKAYQEAIRPLVRSALATWN